MLGKYITSDQLREAFGITQSTLSNWIKDPDTNFPKPIKIGACRLWKLEEIEAYLDKRSEEANAA